MKLEQATIEMLGTADKVTVITKDNTTIVNGAGDKENIKERCEQIKAQIAATKSDYEREKLQERLAKLSGGVAVLYVGAASEVEMKEKKDRVDDALRATRAAIEEGIVPGGGVAYIRALEALEGLKGDNADETTGIDIIKRAIEEPLRQIVANAGKEGAVVVQKVREGKGDFGYNARTDVYENLHAAGVVDPCQGNSCSLENAASIAGMFLTTECVIVEKKEDKPEMPMNVLPVWVAWADTPDGKLTPDLVRPYLCHFGEQHHSQPGAIYISQCSELGTVYKPDELRALTDLAHRHGMYVHMDGARLANACAALNLGFRELTVDCGIDILSFGGTKNGLMLGESVVVFNPALKKEAYFVRKQSAQLASKLRYLSCQFTAYLTDSLWLKNAAHANRMAKILYDGLKELPGAHFTQKVESNQLFLTMPRPVIDELLKDYFFYFWDEAIHEIRFVTSFDTTEEDIEQLLQSVKRLL